MQLFFEPLYTISWYKMFYTNSLNQEFKYVTEVIFKKKKVCQRSYTNQRKIFHKFHLPLDFFFFNSFFLIIFIKNTLTENIQNGQINEYKNLSKQETVFSDSRVIVTSL